MTYPLEKKADELILTFVKIFNQNHNSKCKNIMDVKEYIVKNESTVQGKSFYISKQKSDQLIDMFLDAVNEWESKTKIWKQKSQIIEYCANFIKNYLHINESEEQFSLNV